MGSVGSLMAEKHDLPCDNVKSRRNRNACNLRQPDGLFKKGLSQRELLNYLNNTKKGAKAEKRVASGSSSMERCRKDGQFEIYGKEIDLTKNSLPVGGKFEKSRFRPSAFKPVVPKNFSSMQNLYPQQSKEMSDSTASLNDFSKTDHSPLRNGAEKQDYFRTASQEEGLSDSGRNSMTSLPPCGTGLKHHVGQISSSMGQINHIGSNCIDGGSKEISSSDSGRFSYKSMAVLRGLNTQGNMSPSCELSRSMEDVVRELEDRLHEREVELKHVRRNLNESEDAIAQVFEDKQRLWEKEMEELKRIYASKLRQVTQQAQHTQRTLQLQVFKMQQEKRKLQEDFDKLLLECEQLKSCCTSYRQEQDDLTPRLEETKWEVCQKAGEIALLKQQLRDSQAEVAEKLGELFNLKALLQEVQVELCTKDEQVLLLKNSVQERPKQLAKNTDSLQQQDPTSFQDASQRRVDAPEEMKGLFSRETDDLKSRGFHEDITQGLVLQVERLKAELLLERRQSEAQAASFEVERNIWQDEKEKVIQYQKQLQSNYLEMYQRNQALEQEVEEIAAKAELTETDAKQNLPWIERIESSEI
ncbi:NEDD4-binding protein 3-A [Leucoraja erinacea]|uniref:NEDD4-binding protein 3-A n=1 Tax=Leucoraja erinaceus TaxID=7782 RepID=UPI002456A014|nr:NEDD4-binding protein 3-A [Leucoraja erinacea]XP_055498858.1 NEDD4-binding protein 3-A [Leucoraja erinacea]XP_055498859.1 NEDD4-binding protein 3-A [Leucoraja erinacea]XP_055498860.1 NEDD4-binding protein 3-A [Leucoraja erinacea]XP_055498861.1 NEDD4-binding protein 3-A [Leucoraja erinacea]XP_055498862.1 NEDD4-binding protein 3-A [Leucoraja erinacea]XP_055498863.1 NEDD4-binding protein 3-A [Leucoraja erinacea]XP_055498864.1 NEDD4-binding protein 3-A [Leucoraja erinacea]XP_055498865.1 NEDD